MKLILREHVDHLGDRGETVTVAAGYARNYLLPKGLAYPATPGNLKEIEHQRKTWEVKESQEIGEAQAIAARLGELQLAVVKKAGESGTLYGSVTNIDIAEMLSAKGLEIDRRRIVLEHPIKALGSYVVHVRLHRKVIGEVKLVVNGEEETERDDE